MLLRAASIAILIALAGPSRAEEPMTWGYDPASTTHGSIHKMAYGVPGTEQVLVMLECLPRSGRVKVTSFSDEAPRRLAVTLRSGDVASRHASTALVSQLSEEMIIETIAPARDRVLVAFAGGGDLTVEGGGARTRVPPSSDAGRFLKACAR